MNLKIAVVGLAMVLAGCGGGTSSSSATKTAEPAFGDSAQILQKPVNVSGYFTGTDCVSGDTSSCVQLKAFGTRFGKLAFFRTRITRDAVNGDARGMITFNDLSSAEAAGPIPVSGDIVVFKGMRPEPGTFLASTRHKGNIDFTRSPTILVRYVSGDGMERIVTLTRQRSKGDFDVTAIQDALDFTSESSEVTTDGVVFPTASFDKSRLVLSGCNGDAIYSKSTADGVYGGLEIHELSYECDSISAGRMYGGVFFDKITRGLKEAGAGSTTTYDLYEGFLITASDKNSVLTRVTYKRKVASETRSKVALTGLYSGTVCGSGGCGRVVGGGNQDGAFGFVAYLESGAENSGVIPANFSNFGKISGYVDATSNIATLDVVYGYQDGSDGAGLFSDADEGQVVIEGFDASNLEFTVDVGSEVLTFSLKKSTSANLGSFASRATTSGKRDSCGYIDEGDGDPNCIGGYDNADAEGLTADYRIKLESGTITATSEDGQCAGSGSATIVDGAYMIDDFVLECGTGFSPVMSGSLSLTEFGEVIVGEDGKSSKRWEGSLSLGGGGGGFALGVYFTDIGFDEP